MFYAFFYFVNILKCIIFFFYSFCIGLYKVIKILIILVKVVKVNINIGL